MSGPAAAATTGAPPFRWIALAAGMSAQVSMSSLQQGLPVLGPFLRDAFQLSLPALGVLLAASSWGAAATLFMWGRLADVIGERPVVVTGLSCATVALLIAAVSSGALQVGICLGIAGAMASSAIAASGRAVLGWFPRSERGFALGLRQMAVPLGATIAAIVLPFAAIRFGWPAAFLTLALIAVCGGTASFFGLLPPPAPPPRPADAPVLTSPVKDRTLWMLSTASGLMQWSQVALNAFMVVMLVDYHGLSTAAGAVLFALMQIASGIMRIAAGRLSDRRGRRVPHLRRYAMVMTAALFLAAAFNIVPTAIGAALLVLATVLSFSWNGLAFTAVAELAAQGRAGTALGMHGTLMRGLTIPTAFAFGAAAAALGWSAALVLLALFPLTGLLMLVPIEREEIRRIGLDDDLANITAPRATH